MPPAGFQQPDPKAQLAVSMSFRNKTLGGARPLTQSIRVRKERRRIQGVVRRHRDKGT